MPTTAISNAGVWAKSKNKACFFASNLYIYRMKIINRKLLA